MFQDFDENVENVKRTFLIWQHVKPACTFSIACNRKIGILKKSHLKKFLYSAFQENVYTKVFKTDSVKDYQKNKYIIAYHKFEGFIKHWIQVFSMNLK